MNLVGIIVGIAIGLCCYPALRELRQWRGQDGWDRQARRRVKDLRVFHHWDD